MVKSIYRLVKSENFSNAVVITTLLGAAAADAELDWRLLLIMAANWFSIIFVYLHSAALNAPRDVFLQDSYHYNPVAQGSLSQIASRLLASAFAVLVFGLTFVLRLWKTVSWMPLVLFGFGMFAALIMAVRNCRCHEFSLIDLLILRTLFFTILPLTAYFTYKTHLTSPVLYVILFLVMLSLYHTLSSILNSPEYRKKKASSQLPIARAERYLHLIMISMLVIGIISAFALVIYYKTLSIEIIILIIILTTIMMIPNIKKIRQGCTFLEIQKPLYHSFEKSTALALIISFLIPLIMKLTGN